MTKQEQIQQAEAEVISFQNTINSLNERIDYKQSCLDGLHGKGRVQEIKLEYFDRTVVIPTDQPELFQNVINELEKSIKQQLGIFTTAVDKEKIGLEGKQKEWEALKDNHQVEVDAKIEAEVQKRVKAMLDANQLTRK